MNKISASEECISNWISEIHKAHPDWEQKQIIAVAYSKCEAKKEDFADGFCPYRILSKLDFIDHLEQTLYTNDFYELPISIRIAQAVDSYLPKLIQDFPKKSEIEILKIAYDLAKKVLANSDFEEVKEEPVYFEIYIDDPLAFQMELLHAFGNDFTDDKQQKDTFFAKDQPVASSNVAEIGYENGKLRIFFQNGGGYEYPVPSSWYLEMLNAPSKGQFVWDTLRGRVPGRVIDNPNHMTPGGVGGSIVPYFKIKGAAMSPDTMRESVKGFLGAAVKGNAKVGQTPIRQISKPQYKQYIQFLEGDANRFRTSSSGLSRTFQKITKKAVSTIQKVGTAVKSAITSKSKKKEKAENPLDKEAEQSSNEALRERLKQLKQGLKNAKKANFSDEVIKSLENTIKNIENQLKSDFQEIDPALLVSDFTNDMKHFRGPLSRAGDFEYDNTIKTKDFNNLNEVIKKYKHLPTFDSHYENQILGFVYNLTTDPDEFMKDHPKYEQLKQTPYVYGQGYSFTDIENVAEVPLDESTELPVSFRFIDANEGTGNNEQRITDLIHLAVSVNRTDQDRCSSAGGESCWIQFQQDFKEKEQLDGDFMPEPDKKKKEEEDSPPEEDTASKEDKKDEMESEDFIKIPKAEWLEMNNNFKEVITQISDFKKREEARIAETNAMKLNTIKSDFQDVEQLYKIKSDFIKTADLAAMNILKNALVQHMEPITTHNQLFTNSDFKDELTRTQDALRKKYGVA